jgi:hypothetical protein
MSNGPFGQLVTLLRGKDLKIKATSDAVLARYINSRLGKGTSIADLSKILGIKISELERLKSADSNYFVSPLALRKMAFKLKRAKKVN